MLHTLVNTFPDFCITALVRTPEHASSLHTTYPGLTTIIGTLDSRELLMCEAAKADVVLHASNADHAAGAFSLLDGLNSKSSIDKGLFIHVSGAASLIDLTCVDPGNPERVWSDIDDAVDIYHLPKNRLHVGIERRLMKDSERFGVKTIILAPPMILPSGTGVGKQDSYQNLFARAIMQTGYPFVRRVGSRVVPNTLTTDR